MAQSAGMPATFVAVTGVGRRSALRSRRAVAAVLGLAALLGFTMFAPLAIASGNDGALAPADDGLTPTERLERSDKVERVEPSEARRIAERRLRGADDDEYDSGTSAGPAAGLGSLLGGRSGLFGTLVMAAVFYFFFMRGRAGSATPSWGSYYLFWIVAPALLAAVSSHPEFLGVIVVGLLARRWLPDPIMFFKHRARVRTLQIDIDTHASNATARRDLAKIWLEKHRPQRALPLLERAIARDPNSVELQFLSGVAHLLARQHERAVEALVAVTHREPNFQYGEAFLRAADALIALGRWDDADDALERYVKINSSSIEARCKRVRVCKARKDDEGARKAQADLRDVWRSLPAYQRRRQFGWYLRSLF